MSEVIDDFDLDQDYDAGPDPFPKSTAFFAKEKLFWSSQPIPTQPKLAELRLAVLERSVKRMPKWRFRLSDNTIVLIQPKPRGLVKNMRAAGEVDHFEGVIVRCDNPGVEDFTKPKYRDVYWNRVSFVMWTGPDFWQIKATAYRYSRISTNDREAIMADLIKATRFGLFDEIGPKLMLGNFCLVCGKGLTDPASMARFIGPECAGTSSLMVPKTMSITDKVVDDAGTTEKVYSYEKDPRTIRKPKRVEKIAAQAGDIDLHVYERPNGTLGAKYQSKPEDQPKVTESDQLFDRLFEIVVAIQQLPNFDDQIDTIATILSWRFGEDEIEEICDTATKMRQETDEEIANENTGE